jgi:hypothetical protein
MVKELGGENGFNDIHDATEMNNWNLKILCHHYYSAKFKDFDLERQRAFGYDERNFHLQRFDLRLKWECYSHQNSIDQLKVHQDLKRFKETILALEIEVAVRGGIRKKRKQSWIGRNRTPTDDTKANFEDLKKKTFDFN